MNKNFYMETIKNNGLLSVAEEKELMNRAANNDKAAQDKLVLSNIRFVMTTAKDFKSYGVSFDDLVQAGIAGLVKASKRIKADSKTRFLTYARWWVKEYMQQECRNMAASVRIPGGKHDELKKAEWKFDSLDREIKNSSGDSVSLGSIIKNEICHSPEDEYIQKEYNAFVYKFIKTKLPENESLAVVHRLGLFGNKSKSYAEIGEIIDYSKQGAELVFKRGFKKLKEQVNKYWD